MSNFFGGMSRSKLLILAVLAVIGACLAAASVAAFVYVGYHLAYSPKLAVDGANDIPTLIYIAVPIFLAQTMGSVLLARACYFALRQLNSRKL